MRVVDSWARLDTVAARVAVHLQDVFLLGLRLYVAWQFFKSGWLKLQDWGTTRVLFREEYHVPLLPPDAAAVLGALGETVLPVLLVVGVLTRYAALGLSAVNAVAVIAYAHVLLSPGFEGAVAQHYLWGLVLLTIVVFGAGRYSLDARHATRAGIV
jgi:putative oxidoreductase